MYKEAAKKRLVKKSRSKLTATAPNVTGKDSRKASTKKNVPEFKPVKLGMVSAGLAGFSALAAKVRKANQTPEG